MRSGGITPQLEAILRRTDRKARTLVEAAVVAREAAARRKDEWQAGALSGVSVDDAGVVRLSASDTTVLQHTASDSHITEAALQRPGLGGGPWKVARIEWGGSESADAGIRSITARLHPKRDGGQAKTVAKWRCQLFALGAVEDPGADDAPHTLVPISGVVEADAPGTTEGDITFDFSTLASLPRPKRITPDVTGEGHLDPVTYVFIWGVQADGSPATNVGWAYDSTTPVVTSGGNELRQQEFSETSDDGRYVGAGEGGSDGVPRMSVVIGGYTTGSADVTLDLGAVPTGIVQLLGRGSSRDDSSITWKVRNDADTGWVQWQDGDTTDDLTGVSKRQTYRMLIELAANSAGDATPEVLEVAVREVDRVELYDEAQVQGARYAVDPVDMHAEIAEPKIQVIQDGERDYRDAASDLLAGHYLREIEFDVYVGHPDLERRYWLYVDRYFVEDAELGAGAVTFECLTVLSKLRQVLPVYDTATSRREPLEYTNASLKAVSEAILEDEVALPARFIGPPIEDAATLVTKRITDDDRTDALEELKALARIAGGTWTSSQGRVTFRRVRGDDRAVVAIFPAEEVKFGVVRLGARDRRPEYFVRWGWSDETERWQGQVRALNEAGLTAFDPVTLDDPPELDDATCRWIPTSALAQTVAEGYVSSLGTGLLLASWQSAYPYPELEPGDVVAVETDRFVARDPHSAKELRGKRWVLVRLLVTDDVLGQSFTGWIESYADLLPSQVEITDVGFGVPLLLDLQLSVTQDGTVPLKAAGNADAGGFRLAKSKTSQPDLAAVQAAGVVAATDHRLEDDAYDTLQPGETLHVSGLATENGTSPYGAEQSYIITARISREPGPPILNPRVVLSQDKDTADVYLKPDSPAGENLRVFLKDQEADYTEWALVQGNGDNTPRYVAAETEVGPSDWFWDGSSYAQKLNDIPLTRDQVDRIYLRVLTQDSQISTAYGAIPLDLKGQPWLEKFDAVWDETNDELALKVTAGAHCQSVALEVDDDPAFGSPAWSTDVNLADGATHNASVPLASLSREKVWYARATPYNGQLSGGSPTGIAGVAHVDPERIPPSEEQTIIRGGTWDNTYVDVSNAAPATLTDADNDALLAADGYSYLLHALNLESTQGKGAFATLRSDGSMWSLGTQIYNDDAGPVASPTNDHPQFFLDGGVPKVRLAGGTSVHDVAVTFQRARQTQVPGVELPIEIVHPGELGKLKPGVKDGSGRTVEDFFDKTGDETFDIFETSGYAFIDDAYTDANRRPERIRDNANAADRLPGTFNRHNESAQGKNTDNINFAAAYDAVPEIAFIPQIAKTFANGLGTGADQAVNMKAIGLTASGFTLRAEIQQQNTTTAISDGFSSSRNAAAPENGDVNLQSDGDVAYSNLEDANANETTYRAYYDVDAEFMDADKLLTVYLEYSSAATGGTWTTGASKTYEPDDFFSDEMLSFTKALGADYDVRLRIAYGPGSPTNKATVTAHGEDNATPGVQYDKVTSTGSSESMTSADDSRIAWHAMEAP